MGDVLPFAEPLRVEGFTALDTDETKSRKFEQLAKATHALETAIARESPARRDIMLQFDKAGFQLEIHNGRVKWTYGG